MHRDPPLGPVKTDSSVYRIGVALGIVALVVYFLIVAQSLLVPIAIAVLIWYLLNAAAAAIQRIPIGDRKVPNWLALAIALLVIFGIIFVMGELIISSVGRMSEKAPIYQQNLENLIVSVSHAFGFTDPPNLAQLVNKLDFTKFAGSIANSLTDLVANASLIVIYVLFLLAEQHMFGRKLDILIKDETRRERFRAVLRHIDVETRNYLGIKTVLALLMGVLTFGVLTGLGVDFAIVWALLNVLVYYIPTIGGLIGVVLPALLTLVQFDTIVPFVLVVIIVGGVQVAISNLLEPRMMSKSLNLSAFVVILSLAVWGSIWGVVGMFLCVPITVIAMIILAQFSQTRWLAVLLSSDGNVRAAA